MDGEAWLAVIQAERRAGAADRAVVANDEAGRDGRGSGGQRTTPRGASSFRSLRHPQAVLVRPKLAARSPVARRL